MTTDITQTSMLKFLSDKHVIHEIFSDDIQRELQQKLVQYPADIDDSVIIEICNAISPLFNEQIANDFNSIHSTFTSQVEVLNLYSQFYVNQMTNILKSQANQRTVTNEEIQTKQNAICLVFSNIYVHLKYLLIVNLTDLCNNYSIIIPPTVQLPQFQPVYPAENEVYDQTDQVQPTQTTGSDMLFTPSLANTSTTFQMTGTPCYPGRKPRNFLDKKSKLLLKNWFNSHIQYPYPSDLEKIELAKLCNISTKQINTWFANYRSRYKRKMTRNEERFVD
ncbi:Homeobox protein knotted-1 [Entamoeba marina]